MPLLPLLAAALATACDRDATGPLEPTAFAAVAAGARHTCGISVDGAVYCWGMGEAGELGDGTFQTTSAPRRAGTEAAFITLSAGLRHTCAVTADRDLWCWGWNAYGQLGNATTIGQGLPIPVATNLRVQQVAAGWFHTCALTAAADAFCWGSNGQGQLGDGTLTQRAAPARVAGNIKFAQLSAGGFHTCGVSTTGVLYCWGLNHQGQLGTGDVTNATSPRRVQTENTFGQVSAGYAHTCALDVASAPFCWGSNGAGELGVSFASPPGEPGSVAPAAVHNAGAGLVELDAGFEFTCGTRADGTGWCWGRGQDGQLGTGGFTSWNVAQPVAGVGDFTAIDAGAAAHACGITSSSAILCWGKGDVGQLGVPSLLASAAPVRVAGVEQ
jgi:alpha-tubulin suppressor-like RCC1 family protein